MREIRNVRFSVSRLKPWLWQGGLGSPELLVQEARQPSDRRISVIGELSANTLAESSYPTP